MHPNKQMDEAESLHDRRREDGLLNMLTETIRGLEAVRHCRAGGTVGGRRCAGEEPGEETRRRSEEGTLGTAEDGKEDEETGRNADGEREEKECEQKVLGVLRELSVFHSDRVTAWREVLRERAHMFDKSPPGGSDQQRPSTAGEKPL